jgi:hypothetical protein
VEGLTLEVGVMLGPFRIDRHAADGVLHRCSALVHGMVMAMMHMAAMHVGHFRSSHRLGVGSPGQMPSTQAADRLAQAPPSNDGKVNKFLCSR